MPHFAPRPLPSIDRQTFPGRGIDKISILLGEYMDPHKKGMDDTKYETPRTMRGEMQAAAPHPSSVIGGHISSRGKTGTL